MLKLLLILLAVACSDAFVSQVSSSTTGKKHVDVQQSHTRSTRLGSLTSRLSAITAAAGVVKNKKKDAALKVASAAASYKAGDILAKFLGYAMGVGSMMVYTPIVLNLVKTKDASGYSAATWVFNLLGLTAAIVYPFKKGFPVSTYIEILILTVQSAGILGLVCYYQNLLKEFALGMVAFAIATSLLFLSPLLTPKILNAMQIVAILVCNYANIPQILLTFREKKASWSSITAAMSMGGNLIRIFTTLQLTQDMLVLSGNALGFTTNAILLFQVFYYGKNRK